MSTLSFGNLHAFVDDLEFELEQRPRDRARPTPSDGSAVVAPPAARLPEPERRALKRG